MNAEITRSHSAISSRGTMRPQSRICGSTKAGMNCTAWNSVRANALANRPSAMPRIEPEQSERERRDQRRLGRCDKRERERIADEQVAAGKRGGHQALERPGCPLAEHRDRRDDEHRDEREEAEERDAERLEDRGAVGEER